MGKASSDIMEIVKIGAIGLIALLGLSALGGIQGLKNIFSGIGGGWFGGGSTESAEDQFNRLVAQVQQWAAQGEQLTDVQKGAVVTLAGKEQFLDPVIGLINRMLSITPFGGMATPFVNWFGDTTEAAVKTQVLTGSAEGYGKKVTAASPSKIIRTQEGAAVGILKSPPIKDATLKIGASGQPYWQSETQIAEARVTPLISMPDVPVTEQLTGKKIPGTEFIFSGR